MAVKSTIVVKDATGATIHTAESERFAVPAARELIESYIDLGIINDPWAEMTIVIKRIK